MAERDWGNRPIKSTAGTATNPTTGTLVAEVDSTQLGTAAASLAGAKNFAVTWIVGGSTRMTFLLEHVLSTGLGSTAIRDQTVIWNSTAGSPQYQMNYTLEANDRLRVRLSSGVTGLADAKIVAEPLT